MSAKTGPSMLTANAAIARASSRSPCTNRPVTNVTRRPVRSTVVCISHGPSAGGAR